MHGRPAIRYCRFACSSHSASLQCWVQHIVHVARVNLQRTSEGQGVLPPVVNATSSHAAPSISCEERALAFLKDHVRTVFDGVRRHQFAVLDAE